LSFSIDTSALIRLRREDYPPDVFPRLWRQLDGLIQRGRIVATDEVLRELNQKDDEVHQWAAAQSGMFVRLDEDIQRAMTDTTARCPALVKPSERRGRADPFVIALARARKLTVVTAERSQSSLRKIPGACAHLGVPCVGLVEMFRRERIRV
jgi:hypothetical protein